MKKKQAQEQLVHARFDATRWWADVDRICWERGVNKSELAIVTGASGAARENTRTENPRINTLILIAVWAGLSLDSYIVAEPQEEHHGEANGPHNS